MSYGIWSRQCNSCFGTHKDIHISVAKPKNPVRCPYCGGAMYSYELGKGFRTRPYVVSENHLPVAEIFKAA